MALGASGGNTVALVVRNSVVLVGIGGAVGLVAASLLARSMAGILYGVGPFDLPSFAIAATTLMIAGRSRQLAACARTTRVDPMVRCANSNRIRTQPWQGTRVRGCLSHGFSLGHSQLVNLTSR